MKVNRLKAFTLLRPPFVSVQAPGRGAEGQDGVRKAIPKVPSLLFDLELEDTQAGKENHSDQGDVESVLLDVRSLVDPWNHTEYNLQVHAKVARADLIMSGRGMEAADLAAKLRRLGHSVAVRTALGGGWGGACLRNLRHTFLTCTETDRSGRTTYIIDPKFKEQFEIAHPTKRYMRILEALPEVYVGTEERVEELVELLALR
ncbi:hypothetical protein WJX72_010578 [[Myrmecia] bisecta]|uniref:Rhodanese domain-containing protein n=1 Tax=[Myrmecia] bisecta TaxID=41462 RepID=A0AAW1Q528_9CHLO